MSKQSLSALLDGECSDRELDTLLQQLNDDPALMQAWSRLCLERDVREGVRVIDARHRLADGVMAAVAALPAPQLGSRPEAAPAAARLPRHAAGDRLQPATPRRRRRPLLRPAVGMAAAASFGALGMFLLSPQFTGRDAGYVGGNSAPQLYSLGALRTASLTDDELSLRPVSYSANAGGQTLSHPSLSYGLTPVSTSLQMPIPREYLLNHSDTAAGQGMGGALHYARFAANTGSDGAADVEDRR